ncbi:MAG TPA: hypothetical protein VGB72_01535, partial [Acidobacteriota bacterium]
NYAINTDSKKRCSFVASLFAAGYGDRSPYENGGSPWSLVSDHFLMALRTWLSMGVNPLPKLSRKTGSVCPRAKAGRDDFPFSGAC